MFIAQQKKAENVAEYILYMWQVEDLIRANNLDISKIKETIISKFNLPAEQEKELSTWYENLIEMMRAENATQSGHLQINKNTIINLTDLHKQLLFSQQAADYSAAFYKALPFIAELKAKQNVDTESDIEVAFNFLYGLLLLKLQQKEISEATQQAQTFISKFIALLALKYKQVQNGDLKFD